ncbi:MAG: cupredoxin domain-containing protein [Myxococcales bacterium]
MSFVLLGLALLAAEPAPRERVVHLTARRFTYSPETIEVEEGVPVVLELTSLDRDHGFTVPELGLRIDVEPGKTARVRFVPEKAGTFLFHCDIFCGTGHEEMAGQIVVARRKEARGGS